MSIWIDNRQFPDAQDYDDGNWLNVAAEYRGLSSNVKAEGSFLMTRDFGRFLQECRKMDEILFGEASLHSYEINLDVKLKMEKLGRIEAEISITSDHLTEEHTYRTQMDQSYLKEIVFQCERLLEKFPIRGNP